MSIDKTPFSTDSYQNPTNNVEKTTKEQLKDLAKIADSGKWYKIEEGQIREADRVNFIVRFFKFFSTSTRQNYAELADKFKSLISRAVHDISQEKNEVSKKEMNANLNKIIKKLEKIHVFNQLQENIKIPIPIEKSPPSTPQINLRGIPESAPLSSKNTSTGVSFENVNPNKSIEDAKILYKNHQLNQQVEHLYQRYLEMRNQHQKLIQERGPLDKADREGHDVEAQIQENEKHFRQYQQSHNALTNDLDDLNQKELIFKPNSLALQKEQSVRIQKYRDITRLLNRIVE